MIFSVLSAANPIPLRPTKGNQLNTGQKWAVRVVKIAVFIATIAWLYHQIGDTFTLDDLQFEGSLHWAALCLLLFPINLSLEVIKWKWLTRSFARLSFKQSLIGVIKGNFYALFTPNRIGDGIGRIADLPKGSRSRGTLAFANGSFAQSLSTLLFGTLALVFMPLWISPYDAQWLSLLNYMKWPVFIGVPVALLLYVEPGWMRIFRGLINTKSSVGKRIATLQVYTRRTHALILFLSTLRYGVFTLQFYALLSLYGFEGEPLNLIARIAIVYLISTLVPTAALAEFGLRESLAVAILPMAGIRPEAAFSASLLLFLVNIGVPALAGAVMIKRPTTATTA